MAAIRPRVTEVDVADCSAYIREGLERFGIPGRRHVDNSAAGVASSGAGFGHALRVCDGMERPNGEPAVAIQQAIDPHHGGVDARL